MSEYATDDIDEKDPIEMRRCYAEIRAENPLWRSWDKLQMVSAANERFGKYEKEAKQ